MFLGDDYDYDRENVREIGSISAFIKSLKLVRNSGEPHERSMYVLTLTNIGINHAPKT